MTPISEAPVTSASTSNRSVVQQSRIKCECRNVHLRFSCGHDFVRIHSCDETTGFDNQNQHSRRDVILRTPDVCAECNVKVGSTHDKLAVQVAVGELSEHGSPPKNDVLEGYGESEEELEDLTPAFTRYLNTQLFEEAISSRRGPSESSAATVLHHEPADPILDTDTYILPATTYDPHAPGNISTANNQNQNRAFERRGQVATWVRGTNEFFGIDSSNRDVLFDWLRSEILQDSEDQNAHRELLNPISPLQYLDGPYDTSASSCARTSDGTVHRYDLGAEVSPATVNWILQDGTNDTFGDVLTPSLSKKNHLPELTETRSLSWPIVPIIRITKRGPAISMFGRTRAPKKSLTKIIKSSITKGFRIVSAKLFLKRGIDGRVLQRRNPMVFGGIRLFSRSGTHAERRDDALRRKMLRQKYAEAGFYEVVTGRVAMSDETNSTDVEAPSGSLAEEVDAWGGVIFGEDSEDWVTSSF